MRLGWQDKEIGSFYVFTSAADVRTYASFYFFLFLLLRRTITSLNGDENERPAVFTVHTYMTPNYLTRRGNGAAHCYSNREQRGHGAPWWRAGGCETGFNEAEMKYRCKPCTRMAERRSGTGIGIIPTKAIRKGVGEMMQTGTLALNNVKWQFNAASRFKSVLLDLTEIRYKMSHYCLFSYVNKRFHSKSKQRCWVHVPRRAMGRQGGRNILSQLLVFIYFQG